MFRLLRLAAVAVVALGLALPSGYSVADDAIAAVTITTNPSTESAINASAEVVRKKAALAAKRKAARKRAIRKISMPAYGSVSANFGETSRLWSARHTGLDFSASTGDGVYNVMKGKVIFTGWAGSYGNLVVVRTVRGGDIWYAHLSKIKVKTGKKVKSGAVLGLVGSTGNSTGSHLHLEIRKNDFPVNPAVFLWGKHRGNIKKQTIPAWAYGDRIAHLSDF